MTGARLKLVSLAGIALLSGAIFVDWSQTWFTLTMQGKPFPVSGQIAGGALSALALASLALIAALAIAGRFFRPVLGVLLALLGVCVIAVSAFAIGNPVVASTSAITKATGVAGTRSVAHLVSSTSLTAWPFVAVVLGALLTLLGLAIAVTARSWPDSGRKYARSRLAAPDAGTSDPVQEWDALSDGDDPTRP
jgi:uncharacterized membrane protein (TIGR02234 family)